MPRYVRYDDRNACELAIVLADDWQGRGLGRLPMTLLVDTAQARGLTRIDGDVLAINRPMLALVRVLGCRVGPSGDPTTRRVERSLRWRG